MITFVRHEKKAWVNKDHQKYKFGFDPPIVSPIENVSKQQFRHIYCSPFRRCIQTKDCYKYESFEIVPEIREYLGYWKNHRFNSNNFHPETYKYIRGLNLKESIEDLKRRIISWLHNTSFEEKDLVITHGFCLQIIKNYLGPKNIEKWIKEDSFQIEVKKLSEILLSKNDHVISENLFERDSR